jgi:hypothetical protein
MLRCWLHHQKGLADSVGEPISETAEKRIKADTERVVRVSKAIQVKLRIRRFHLHGEK